MEADGGRIRNPGIELGATAPVDGRAGRTRISVGVVDDDAIVRAWVRLSLQGSEFRVAGEAQTAAEAQRLVDRRGPALLLVDYRLPDRHGTDLVRELRRHGVRAPVLLITAAPEVGLNEAAREAGAQGVVLKRGDADVLLRALRDVVSGRPVVDPSHPRRPPERATLSRREREVLALAASGSTNGEIAGQLGVSRESVKTLLRRAFAKLGARNRMEAVASAQGQGML